MERFIYLKNNWYIMERRKFISTVSAGAVASLAGCQLPSTDRVQSMSRPYLGDEDSDVVVKVFEDYACPACRSYTLNVKPQIIEQYVETDQIKYEHYDYPLPVHQRWSYEVPNAARAVLDRTDSQTFFDFSDRMFENQNELSVDLIREQAEAVGVDDVDGVVNDAAASLYRPVIRSDRETGDDEYNVSGTPTVVVNGSVLSSYEFEVVQAAIDGELE